MGIDTIIGNFVSGIGSAVFQIGTLKTTLSSTIAGGVEGGIRRAMPMLMKNIVLGAIFLTGTFLFGIGLAKWAESLFTVPGAGFILTGLALLAVGSYCLPVTLKAADK
ncbi:MAG TPA: hypothetical protein HA254_01495 [Candidatus Diapherotrites archaeon]|uniref:Uncharacterized protein n=1 Tax=Candidatus Iainarchaeum sp. TaxID=3101447 RepID=A0A7J4IUX6_9ARCH|nr:hypothetical protein [Candidatus Diapherotrites archaeon]